MATDTDKLLHIFNHFFLPQKLPQKDDFSAVLEMALLSTTIGGLNAWKGCTDSTHLKQADAAISTLHNMKRAHSSKDGSLLETEVLRSLTRLEEGTAIPLLVREQNAGVLISRHRGDIFFEVFESSPENKAIMTAKGRLRRSFPGATVVISATKFQQDGLQATIAHTLAEMSKHPVEAVQPKAKKARNLLHEDRDTNHPGMVSEILMGFLRSIGEAVESPVIAKNMRDDVLWNDARSPWRRSPLWLVVRVALQLGFNRKAEEAQGSDTVYKEAMLFILCHALKCATNKLLPSEVLFSMNAKLARRLVKIGSAISRCVLPYIQNAMRDAHAVISRRWSMVQQRDARQIDPSELLEADFINDSYVSLPGLDKYIAWMSGRRPGESSGGFQLSSQPMNFPPHELPRLPQHFSAESEGYAIASMEAFETWVALNSREWSQHHRDSACAEISSLVVIYHQLALRYYSNNPEALSIMVLTIFELWIACDDAAVRSCPLLGQYDPGLPCDILQNLLLPFASQLQRLHRVEQYLADRSSVSRFPYIKLYYHLESPDCFAVRFFERSTPLQEKFKEIIRHAESKKRAKLEELQDQQREYKHLKALSDERACEYEEVLVDSLNNFYDTRHKRNCQRCSYANQAEELRIHIHEWPLPLNSTKAKAVVFELQIPPYLQSWRQATFYLLRNVVEMEYLVQEYPRSSYRLSSDPHLSGGTSSHSWIGLLSQDKPQVATHRDAQKVSIATANSVCVNNGLNYRYFDSSKGCFVEPFSPSTKVPKMCVYLLPTRSKTLQKYLFRPANSPNGPDPNIAIAGQSETPEHMSIEEARDLATLPLGHRIQFLNILTQLAAPSLDFKKEETAIFILQCLYQAGPPSNTLLRDSHALADDREFTHRLLESVATAWNRVKENWESAQALGVFAAITTRLLSLTSSEQVKQRCLGLLGTLQTGAFDWVQLLREKSQRPDTQENRAYFMLKSADIALICASCFDAEGGHLSSILESDANASIFVQCSILIHEAKRTYNPASELVLTCLSHRFCRLLYRSSFILSKTHAGISDAVKQSWSAYRPGGNWRTASDSESHWLVTETASDSERSHLQVHYNLLSGELLVNGLPLGRPPPEYEAHPMWATLFGNAPVEVMPTSAAGMQFSVKRQYKGYDVHFSLRKDLSGSSDLLVQATNSTSKYDIVPVRLLQKMFPAHFIDNFVHWYNHMNGTLEFRPRVTPWNSDDSAWVLSRSLEGWTLMRKGSAVLGMGSRTAAYIADVLSPLAEPSDIHVFLQPSTGSPLEVELPVLRLGFFLTSGESNLKSREFRDMSVDSDQSLGTLVGFTNKLVLRHDSHRVVLVPEGPVSWVSASGHIRVMVSKASIVKVHPLRVDDVLGQLTDNGNLQGKLFIAYLHALTSYCLPDPLTNSTGVERALSILNSAAVRSFDRLSQSNVNTLTQIACLTPKRQYYPTHERVMQTVSWCPDLVPLSQHDGFYRAVTAILEQARQTSLFYPDSDSSQLDIRSHVVGMNEHLLERDRIRSSTFRVSGFGAEEHTTAHDVIYHGRDRDQASPRGTNAYVLSDILYHERTTRHIHTSREGELWEAISTMTTIFGPSQSLYASQLRYSADAVNSGLDLSQWPALHRVLSTQRAGANKFSLMIWLSALGAAEQANMSLLQVLALFCTTDEFKDISLPSIQSCHPSKGYEATSQRLRDTIRSNLIPLKSSPEAGLRANPGENRRSFERRRDIQFSNNQNGAVQALVTHIHKQWPRETLSTLSHVSQRISDYIKVTKVEDAARKQFKEWFDNLQLFEYLQHVESMLFRLDYHPLTFHQQHPAVLTPPSRLRTFVSVSDLFASPAPTFPVALPTPPVPPHTPESLPSLDNGKENTSRLTKLIDVLKTTSHGSQYEALYVKDLHNSMVSLQGQESPCRPHLRNKRFIESLPQHLDDCTKRVELLYQSLSSTASAAHGGLLELGNGPRLSPLLFLQQLKSRAWQLLSPDWRQCIAHYGLALSTYQRAARLVRAAISSSDEDMIKELENVGHQSWDPHKHPEWLLLEVESGIMIRDVQAQIASEMMNPRSHRNTCMQLNMGEGKSSVIAPITATELANGSQLARVIVAKAQSKQMAQMLTSKLGGLLDRRVYHMPFSRALKISTVAMAETIDKIIRECRANGGILLVQPEHLLSLQLMGLECYCGTNIPKQDVGSVFMSIQDFFDRHSRDIVDESDENFSVKFELIYTMGSQRPIELSPDRWICIQHVLGLVRTLALDISEKFPKSMAVNLHEGRYPRVRILKSGAGELLVNRVARHICDKGIGGLPIARQPEHTREAVFKYITRYTLSREEISSVEKTGNGAFWTETTKPLILLLRGILAGGVLAFTLGQKRWRVNYGLANARTPPTKLAVPYRAKDNPTPRSEFSHPDVVVLLTSLTYYYDGLEDEDLFIALGHLMDSDQANIEYDAWIKDAPNIPMAFRQLEGINLKDRPQCVDELFPYLRYGKSVIDYFLGHIVFPKEMKEFPHKLSASGWDIGKTKTHCTTGFSGTSDSRKFLPLDMHHLDLPSQTHTNALVLKYLLQPENSVVSLLNQSTASVTDAECLLEAVVALEKPTRVILDVGAQILELNNQEVAQTWLKMHPDVRTQAVVFVSDDDELLVIDRGNRVEPLQTSSYASQLESCLVFLDEAHTRGIDLNLPEDYRAAVTLGSNLTKDRLVQACMRMRKLGKGQSVVFCVTPEIRTKISECTTKPEDAAIGVEDVLNWAISETFAETRRSMPLWAVQGSRFLRQEELWKSVRTDGVTSMSKAYAEQFLDDEAQSIQTRYCPRTEEIMSVFELPKATSPRLSEIEERCREFEHLQFNSSALQEEQERELSPEIEQERQVQRPDPARPADHFLHPDVEKFVATGRLMPASAAFMRAFRSLRDTSAAAEFEASQLSNDGHLFVTADFAKTVKVVSDRGYVSDSFQRPVQWILSSQVKGSNVVDMMVIISPYEAEKLIPRLHSGKPGEVTMHLYRPRFHTGHPSFDHLDFFNIPARQTEPEVPRPLLTMLNLFAGQLYFNTYEDYKETCRFLNLADAVPKEGEVVAADGYILQGIDGESKFDKSPVRFLQVLMSKIRRNGKGISKTHVGRMLEGQLLQELDIEE
ncbi:hypothetical protein F4779DRAFT_591005 [Xylariaceae sp. FL0662B]|nr:hypothetical protein F4779DRAFT_591005 [Xylariaceae sp. FL0662B]